MKRYTVIIDGKEEMFDVYPDRYDAFIAQYPEAVLIEETKSGDTTAWSDFVDRFLEKKDLKIEDYVEVSSFGHKFKISRLDDWIKAVKKADKLPKYREEK